MQIITDTREQLPYWTTERKTLIVGDYTTKKLLGKFHIERKSLQDLYGTITSGNQRFKHELFRAAYHRINIEIYVEGSLEDFIAKKFPKGEERKVPGSILEKLVKTFEKKYYLKFVWAKNRNDCRKLVEKRLEKEEKAIKK